MKTKKAGLRRARRLYRRRDYAQLINYLEPQVFMFRDNPDFYRLLGLGCLRTGDFAGAHSYLMRARDLDDENVETLLALGAAFLRRRQIDRALGTFLSILDIEPRNARAKRALSMLRTLSDPDEIEERFPARRLNRILPPRPAYLPKGIAFIAGAIVFSGILFLGVRTIVPIFLDRGSRPGIDLVSPVRSQIETRTNGEFALVMSDREIEHTFRTIRANFDNGRDNLVRRELNRIALSNASLALQDRAALLWDYLKVPDFTTFSDNYTYQEVVSEPALYNGVYVRWRGRTANRVVSEDEIVFDLLVGFETGQVLDGTVPVSVPFSVLIDNDSPVELIGKVRVGGSGFSLVVNNIRVLSPAELENHSR